jgi:beta-lactamase class A
MKWRKQNFPLGYTVAGFIAGALVASLAALIFYTQTDPPTVKALRESDISSSSGYTYTDPLIGLTSNSGNTPQDYVPLQQQIQSYINTQNIAGLNSTSVKFSDILQSEGFTINPDELYDPASLTKVPLAMAYYDIAEQDPSILSDQIEYTGTPNLDANEQIRSAVQLMPGQSYSVETLIEHMIRYSDNNAEQLLADHLSATGNLKALNALFGDLGVKVNPDNTDYMTVQSYSLFLRVLFNATYLDRDYSEKLLQLLTQSDFSQGIDSGVPNNISVAEKFGYARIPDAQGNIIGAELQNCGIIYHPHHPYLLCIMTKGSDIPELERVIENISQIVFQTIEARYPLTTN